MTKSHFDTPSDVTTKLFEAASASGGCPNPRRGGAARPPRRSPGPRRQRPRGPGPQVAGERRAGRRSAFSGAGLHGGGAGRPALLPARCLERRRGGAFGAPRAPPPRGRPGGSERVPTLRSGAGGPGPQAPPPVGGRAAAGAGFFSPELAGRAWGRGPARRARLWKRAARPRRRRGLPATLPPSPAGSGSSQRPAGRKREAGAACAPLVCSPAAPGPALRRRCWLRRFAGGQCLSAPARPSTRPFSPSRPVASTLPVLSRPVSYSGRRGSGPDGSVQRRLQGQSLAWGSLPYRLRTKARLRGRGATARGPSPPPPPSPSAQPCGPGSGASGGTGRGLWHVSSSGAAGALLVLPACRCLRPPSSGVGEGVSPLRPHRRPASPRSGAQPAERGPRVGEGGERVRGLPQPSLRPFRGLGAFCGDPGTRRRQGRVRASRAGIELGPPCRLPATPFPARPRWRPPSPRASLGGRGGQAGPR